MAKKLNNKYRLDLFKLHDQKDTVNNWLLAKGKNLEVELKNLINRTNLSNTELVKHLMKKLKISITTAERLVYLKREWYPLVFIKEVVRLTKAPKYEIQDNIEFLKSSKPPVVEYKAVKELTINLCKFVGAHAADGTLFDNLFRLTENKLSTIQTFRKIIDAEFGINSKIVKIKNSEEEWGIEFHSRIISRYLMKFFDFPSGSKTYDFKEPKIIRNSSYKFRKAYALGALTFEAGIGMTHEIGFATVNKDFRDSLYEILKSANLKVTLMKRKSSMGLWRFWSGRLTKEEALEWQVFFEPYSRKWQLLNYYINGYKHRVGSFEEASKLLDLAYPRKASSKIILKDVLSALKELKQTHRYKLAEYLIKKNNLKSYGGKWAHSLRHYLDILKEMNIISIEKGRFGKKKSFGTIIRDICVFNEEISEWRLPGKEIIEIFESEKDK